MSKALRQLTAGVHPNYEGTWFAVVHDNALNLNDEVNVVIPAFDPLLSWGPCRWMPRGDLTTFPQKGDECIVTFDDNNHPWILSWWPFT